MPVLDARRQFEIENVYYSYELLDASGGEILAYHWHPDGMSNVEHPHLHVSATKPPVRVRTRIAEYPLSDMHLPTGHITFVDIVRLLIDEFGVEPLRDDWRAVLAASEDT